MNTSDQETEPCMGADTSFVTVGPPLAVTPIQWSWKYIIDDVALSTVNSISFSNMALLKQNTCQQVSSCNVLTIAGKDTICVLGQEVDFVASKNAGCNKKVEWQVDSSSIYSLKNLNDSTVRIRFKMPGAGSQKVFLYASAGDCSIAKDTMAITLLPVIKPLPEDTVLCEGNTVRLSVGDWFKNYLWQDGSMDSIFTVSKPGTYFVQVQTYCGYVLSDTIRVEYKSLSSKTDQLMCFLDTATLHARPGFSNYKWSPDDNLISISGSIVRVFPDSTTAYTVTAQSPAGCIARDTVLVTVKPLPRIHLGNDTTFCNGGSLTLSARARFQTYYWSNGATTATITVTQPATYSLAVKDSYGCTGRDTIIVTAKDCPNKIFFPSAFTPNGDGRNDHFKPHVEGAIEEYEFVIYNRWGKVVFKTNNTGYGWNGMLKNSLQDTNVFLWVCRYKFRNEAAKVEKGSFMLIR